MKFSFWWIFLVGVLVSVCLVNRVKCVNWGITRDELYALARAYEKYCLFDERQFPDKRTYDLVCAARWSVFNSLQPKDTSPLAAALLLLMQATYFEVNYVEDKKPDVYRRALMHHLQMSPTEIVAANKDEQKMVHDTFAIILKVVIKYDCFKEVREEFLREVFKRADVEHDKETDLHVWRIFETATHLLYVNYVERLMIYKESQTPTNINDSMPQQTQRFNAIFKSLCLRRTGQSPFIQNEPPTEPTLQLTDILRFWLGDSPMPQILNFNSLYNLIIIRMEYWEQVQMTDIQARAIIHRLTQTIALFGKIGKWSDGQINMLRACIQMLAVSMQRKFPDGPRGEEARNISLQLLIIVNKLIIHATDKFGNTGFGNCEEILETTLVQLIDNKLPSKLRTKVRFLRSSPFSGEERDEILAAAENYLKKYTNTNRQ